MSKSVPITVAHGDGIGPEIMDATLHILKAAGANLDIETIDIGEKVYLAGNSSGIEPSADFSSILFFDFTTSRPFAPITGAKYGTNCFLRGADCFDNFPAPADSD